jgi:hypothetical protein
VQECREKRRLIINDNRLGCWAYGKINNNINSAFKGITDNFFPPASIPCLLFIIIIILRRVSTIRINIFMYLTICHIKSKTCCGLPRLKIKHKFNRYDKEKMINFFVKFC